MSMTKVWNITDANGPGHQRMVLGRNVKPGRAVQVEEARLVNARKVLQDRDAGLLYIGVRPPAWYLAKKKPPRAKVDARLVGPDGRVDHAAPQVAVAQGHGRLPAAAIAADSTEAVDAVKVEEEAAPMEDPVEPEQSSEDPDETPAEEDSSSSRRGRRGRRR